MWRQQEGRWQHRPSVIWWWNRKMGREKITILFARAEALNTQSWSDWESGRSNSHLWMTSEDHKKNREAWVLGRFAEIYNQNQNPDAAMDEVEVGEGPDFSVFNAAGDLITGLEVTEWLEPYRKRDEEYSGEIVLVRDVPDHRPDPLVRLEEQLLKKFKQARKYNGSAWLVLHNNVGRMGLVDAGWEGEEKDIEAAIEVINRLDSKRPETISQVWVFSPTRNPALLHRVKPTPLRIVNRTLT
jgi:hypothetical protein